MAGFVNNFYVHGFVWISEWMDEIETTLKQDRRDLFCERAFCPNIKKEIRSVFSIGHIEMFSERAVLAANPSQLDQLTGKLLGFFA